MKNLPTTKNNNFLKVELVLPLLIAILSSLNLLSIFQGVFTLSQIVSIVGLVGVVLYFFRNPYFKYLFYLWILVQIIVVDVESTNPMNGIVQKNNYLEYVSNC